MPSSPEHLSDRCLSIFFYILLNSFQIKWYTFSGRGGFYPRSVFRGGGFLCGGNSMLQHRKNIFKQIKEVGVLTEKI